jgi:hypothetical protein
MNPISKALKVAAQYTARHPTAAQKAAGNYRKGSVPFFGLDISIENPKGGTRSGTDKGGKKWSVTMPAHYGYIKNSLGKDGDHVDCYIGPDLDSQTVFVVDQIDAETGAFDEHKCCLAYSTQAQAVADYTKAFSDGKGKARIGAVTQMPLEAFKAWVRAGNTKKPLGQLAVKRASGGAVQDILSGLYGEGFQPEEGLDQPVYDTSQLAERLQRFEQVPEWMKAVEPYDAALSHWLQASPWGGYPEALDKQDLPYGPLGTLPWVAAGAAKALAGKPAFDVGKNATREQLWDDILARGLMPARADGGEVGDPIAVLLQRHYGDEETAGDHILSSLTPAALPRPEPPQAPVEDYAWSPLPLPPGEVSALTRASMARKRALSPVVSEGAWLAGYPSRVYHRLMGRNPDGSVEVDPRGIANRATPHGADNQALMDGVQSLEPKGWSVEGRESKNVIDRRSKDPWEYD